MTALTWKQRLVLEELRDRADGPASKRGCTNPTLSALERRELVRLTWVPHGGDGYRVEHWAITDKGFAAIGPKPAPRQWSKP